VRGVVQENRLDITVASFPEGVSTPMFRGWRFLPEFKSLRGIGSSKSTRFHEGLVLGNSGKTLHPRNVGFAEIHEISFQVMFKNNSRIWLLRVNMLSVSGWLNLWRSGVMNLRHLEITNLWRSGVMNLRSSEIMNPRSSGIMNLRRLGIMNLWGSGVMNLRSFGVMNLRNSGIGNLWNSGIYWTLNSEVMMYEDFHV
jgi:hypothetical protein